MLPKFTCPPPIHKTFGIQGSILKNGPHMWNHLSSQQEVASSSMPNNSPVHSTIPIFLKAKCLTSHVFGQSINERN